MKKVLPNVCVAGGMPNELLGKGSISECVDYAHGMLDSLAPGGRYIYSESKMLTYKNDAKRENLKAVTEFVRDYRG